jgi:sugar lactone lactonase YvrE
MELDDEGIDAIANPNGVALCALQECRLDGSAASNDGSYFIAYLPGDWIISFEEILRLKN